MHYRGAEIKLLEPQLRVRLGRHSISQQVGSDLTQTQPDPPMDLTICL
jgi:hypothetical protein